MKSKGQNTFTVYQNVNQTQPVILFLQHIALWPITYTAKMFAANMLVAVMFPGKLRDAENLNLCIVVVFLASQSMPWRQVKPSNRGISSDFGHFHITFMIFLVLPLLHTSKYIIHLSSLGNMAD